ncbi:MAG: class II aldolase/adducin family protein [Methylobacterium sp.]|nr:class II aldolase/adducin family protein [Methylobacterium sp.]MCA3619849.1 class II aldolase/adducin family protein [Methylobacterium sp.]
MANLHRIKTKDDAEWALRCDLAATFRLSAREKWNEGIGNHNSAMIPGSELMLINPRGMIFHELRASDLIVCDLRGNVVSGNGELRKVAHHIHSRIHLMHPQARIVLHVHPPYTTALSLVEGGRLEMSHFNDLTLHDRIAYDDEMNGVVDDDSEGDRIARLLGRKSTLVMGSHGLTTVGPTVAEAFCELAAVERTAMWQTIARSHGMPLRKLPDVHRRGHFGPFGEVWDAALEFAAYKRILDREEPDYAH